MSELRIITNHHSRPLLSWYDLDEKQQAWVKDEHAWLWNNEIATWDEESFIPYKGWIYTLSDFMRTDSPHSMFTEWDGYLSDSFFSGILIKYARDEWDDLVDDEVVVGWYYS